MAPFIAAGVDYFMPEVCISTAGSAGMLLEEDCPHPRP
jgi:hypothetical protein